MPVLAMFQGIVIRMLTDRTFGVHLHAFHGNSEMVVALDPVRMLQSDAPIWVERCVLEWARRHECQFQRLGQLHRLNLLHRVSACRIPSRRPSAAAAPYRLSPTV